MLIDAESALTLINSSLVSKLDPHITKHLRPPPSNVHLQLADRSQIYISHSLKVPININSVTIQYTVYVVPQLWRSCIIGNNFIRENNLQIDGGKQHVYHKTAKTATISSAEYRKRKTQNNKRTYILCATEQVTIPPYHAYNISVKPNVPFRSTNNKEHEQYELHAYVKKNKEHNGAPRIANGILTPMENLRIQVANLSKATIRILIGEKLGVMTRMNYKQINAIDHLATRNIEEKPETDNENSIDFAHTDLSNDQKTRLYQLIEEYPDVFKNSPGKTSKIKHQINIKEGARPFNAPPYRCTPKRRKIIEDNINEMLKEEIITPSNSPWASPVVLAPKKDGSLRFCIDYRKLNALTIRDAYPIPRIDDTLDALEEAKFISTLDLRSGYWQVQMDPKSQALTAFITHKGLFEFKVMPYGLTNAPATFQRLMDIVLAGLKW